MKVMNSKSQSKAPPAGLTLLTSQDKPRMLYFKNGVSFSLNYHRKVKKVLMLHYVLIYAS